MLGVPRIRTAAQTSLTVKNRSTFGPIKTTNIVYSPFFILVPLQWVVRFSFNGGWSTHHSAVVALGSLAVDQVVELWRDAENAVDADDRVDDVVCEDRELHRTNVLWTESNTHVYTLSSWRWIFITQMIPTIHPHPHPHPPSTHPVVLEVDLHHPDVTHDAVDDADDGLCDVRDVQDPTVLQTTYSLEIEQVWHLKWNRSTSMAGFFLISETLREDTTERLVCLHPIKNWRKNYDFQTCF